MITTDLVNALVDLFGNYKPAETKQIGGDTILTRDLKPCTQEDLKQQKQSEEALDVCSSILELTLSTYAEGDITFENAVRLATRTATKAEHIPKDFQWQKMLGAFIR